MTPGFLWLTLLGFIAYYISSVTGSGYGTIAAPLLILAGYNIRSIVPGIIVSQLVSNILLSLLHQKAGNMKLGEHGEIESLVLMAGASAIGAGAATFIFLSAPQAYIEYYISAMLISLGVAVYTTRKIRLRVQSVGRGLTLKLTVLSFIASLNKGLTGGGLSPLISAGQVLLGVDPRKAVSVTPLIVVSSEIVMLSMYLGSGVLWESSGMTVPLTLGALLAVPLIPVRVRSLTGDSIRLSMSVAMVGLGTLLLVL